MTSNFLENIPSSKQEKYDQMLPQILSLVAHEPNVVANLANVTAVIKMYFDFYWIGFYWVDEDSLVLGPFQGTVACTRIAKGRGVCGKAWETQQTQLVNNVALFTDYIACDSTTKSEIVVPCFQKNKVVAVLDIDSDQYDTFDAIDSRALENLMNQLFLILPSFSH